MFADKLAGDKLADKLVDKSRDELKMVVEPSLLKGNSRNLRF